MLRFWKLVLFGPLRFNIYLIPKKIEEKCLHTTVISQNNQLKLKEKPHQKWMKNKYIPNM